MSKKNKLSTRRNAHQADLAKEKNAAIRKKQKEERKVQNKLPAGGSLKNKTKKKGIRLRKNVKIRGIKVKDAESKQAVRELLKEEKQNRMDED
mmetsp:Transcript_10016/g.23885  ORF Transcript_10016/g.23885 Transcript_10016/m.23885 type:complete len:93 (+) Transcript_10016:130-408(+)